ncbi:MAG: peptidyl-prolyl cis-trans isomerase [Pyrinomonadaceae bacterium]
MLKFFKRLEKTRNFVLLLFSIVMVGSLVFFYTPSSNTLTANLAQSEESVASVSGHAITIGELVRQKENYSQFGRGQTFPTKMILDGLIGSRIARVEAERLGLTASDAEVAAEIRERNKPTDGTPFNQAIYEQNVIESFGNISSYEQSVRDDLSSKKLEAFITSGVTVSEQEVLDDFQRKNTKFDVSYVAVNTTDLSKKITPTDAELRDYFEKNKQSYFVSSPQKKIKYVFVNTAKIGEKLNISDADLKAEYDGLTPDKKVAGVLGQEIVLRVPKPDQEGQVAAKGAELVQQLKKDGPTVSEEAFATVAKGHSENPATAQNGGKLTGPVKQNPNKPDDPYQRLLTMKPGDITEPISYQGRYFILRRGEDVPKSYETAKKEIEVSLRNRRAYAVAAELAQKVADSLKQTKDAAQTAQAFAAEANMSAADMVKETNYIKPGDDVPNIGVSPQFEEGIAPLANVGDVGEKTPIQNGFSIPILADKKEPRDAEFDEVKDQIVDVVKLEQARAQVETIAKQIAEAAGSAGALSGAASGKGLTAKDQKNFVLGSPLGEGPTAATSEELEDAVYAMKAGEVTKTPLKVGDNWYVVAVNSREEADTAEFAKQRSSLMEQMLATKRMRVFSDFLAASKQTMEGNGSIKIYQAAIDKIDEPIPGLTPPVDPIGQ